MNGLYIHKVPTVVSMAQLLEKGTSAPGEFCSPDKPISECADCILPTIVYPFSEASNPHKARSFGQLSAASIVENLALSCTPPSRCSDSGSSSDTEEANLFIDNDVLSKKLPDYVLVQEWDRKAAQGLFRYDVTECESKATDGVYGFIAQLNEGRATKKRATEFRVDQVCQTFDASKFNFTKAAMKEVLFQFKAGATTTTQYHASGSCTPSPNLVLINVSPIEYGHMLLVPRVNDCIPQLVDQTTTLFALQFVREVANPFFRLGYNSLGAFGTINHLHFQGYYLQMPYPVERAPTVPVATFPEKVRGVRVERLEAYPVHGWVFSGAANVDSMASLVGALCMKLQTLNVPHNLLICDMGERVMLWPQCFAEKQAKGLVPEELLDMGVNPAAFEIAGHMVLKRRCDYEALNQDTAWRLLEQVSLTDAAMAELQTRLFAGLF